MPLFLHQMKSTADSDMSTDNNKIWNKEREIEERDEEKVVWPEIKLAIEELSLGSGNGEFSTLAFLGLSNLLLQVLDKIGPTMAVLRLDIQRNIERLEEINALDPSKHSTLIGIVENEVREGAARKADSCVRAILWLTRSMDFSLVLLEILEKDSELSLSQVVEEAYKSTLKPWHGWISSAAFKVGLKLIPERKYFISLLTGKGQDYNMLKDEIHILVPLLRPLLDEIHCFMKKFRLDRLKST